MGFRLLWAGVVLAVIFALGSVWISLNEPRRLEGMRETHASEERRQGKEALKQCCLQDIRSAQEALILLSVEAQKLRIRLNMNSAATKDPSGQKIISAVTILAEQPRGLWDQLEALLNDSHENKRRQLRDLRINMEGLKEQFQVAESCCGSQSALLTPIMKEYLQIAAYRFGVVWDTIATKDAEANGQR